MASNDSKIILEDFEDADKWENRELGASEAHVRVSDPSVGDAVDESLGLQSITIRLQKSLVEDLKMLAKIDGLGYQPFMRRALTKYVAAQKEALHLKARA